ncbi:MAG: phosphodiester glycosidase family protein [Clostridia bacterium]|nr:phosphodiester glycosidase family protein [Clostridia bacterium]
MTKKEHIKGIRLQKKFITSVSFLDCHNKIKVVVCVKKPTFDAKLHCNGTTYIDAFNDAEPYDRKSHVFYIDKKDFQNDTLPIMTFKLLTSHGMNCKVSVSCKNPVFACEKDLIAQYDNGLTEETRETEALAEGVTYHHILYKDKNGAPVHAFLTDVDTAKAEIYIGTPNDGYESVGVRATIPDMITSAIKNGKDVITAVNADFFDIFGDFHPSGLCVKNGRVVANENSTRPFIGVKKDGTHILTDINESEGIIPQLQQAAAGIQMVLKDGEVSDYAPLEPFSFVRHPRTCAGVRKDGSVLILIVDGRIPEYSNGASLVDLARLMQSYGADRALNLDGGGSSAVYTKKGSEHILRSRPADLFRPTARLIRKDYNALLVVKKD